MGGVIIGIIVVCAIIKLASDWSITSNCTREGHEAFKRGQQGQQELYRKISRESDVFYNGSICGPDFSRHADGTPKK